MNTDKLTNKLFNSRFHPQFSRINSYIIRQQYYPEIIINIEHKEYGVIKIDLCRIISDFVELDDMCLLCHCGNHFVEMFRGQNVQIKHYVVQNMEELEYCHGVIGEFPDFEFIFFDESSQKSFYEREVYES